MAKTKYSKKAQEKIGKVMLEFKEGKLKSGSGKKVRDRQQAIAIGISEAREEGLKVPKEKSKKKDKPLKKEKAKTKKEEKKAKPETKKKSK